MNTETASDEVTDSIAHIEMHRQETAKEASLSSACNEALRKLHELLKHEQEELQKNGPQSQHTANITALGMGPAIHVDRVTCAPRRRSYIWCSFTHGSPVRAATSWIGQLQ